MGTSFTNYGGYGFWARDDQVEVWLALMVRQMDRDQELTEHRRTARDHFALQSSGIFLGFVSPELDTHAAGAEKTWILDLSQKAMDELTAQGKDLDRSWLNNLFQIEGCVVDGDYFQSDGPFSADRYIGYGKMWIALLSGSFTLQETAWIGDIHADGVKCYPKPE